MYSQPLRLAIGPRRWPLYHPYLDQNRVLVAAPRGRARSTRSAQLFRGTVDCVFRVVLLKGAGPALGSSPSSIRRGLAAGVFSTGLCLMIRGFERGFIDGAVYTHICAYGKAHARSAVPNSGRCIRRWAHKAKSVPITFKVRLGVWHQSMEGSSRDLSIAG